MTSSIHKNLFFGLVALSPIVFYLVKFSDLFLLIEYRQWVNGSDVWGPASGFLTYSFSPTSNFSRSFSLLVASVFGATCDASIECHNLLNIALLGGTSLGIYVVANRLTAWRFQALAALASVAFLLSHPAIDAVGWQATLHDRVGALLCIWTVYIFVCFDQKKRWWEIVLVNFVGLIAIVATYNSKEATWPVIGSLALLVLSRQLTEFPANAATLIEAVVRTGSLLLLPGMYVVYKVTTYATQFANSGYVNHAFGGNRLKNLNSFVGYHFNLSPKSAGVDFYFAAFLGMFVVGIVLSYAFAKNKDERTAANLTVWAVVSFLAFIAVPSGTLYGSPFYLVVPAVFLTLAIFFLLARAASASAAPRSMTFAVAAVFLLHQVVAFKSLLPEYEPMITFSQNVRKLLKLVRTEQGDVTILYPSKNHRGYMFFDPPEGRALEAFAGSAAKRLDIRSVRNPLMQPPSERGATYWLDENLAVMRRVEGPSGG
ncbi:MAG TPA: hypothetical protein VIL09_13025 [Microvirga sp.]|jgi:hypothetical protein